MSKQNNFWRNDQSEKPIKYYQSQALFVVLKKNHCLTKFYEILPLLL